MLNDRLASAVLTTLVKNRVRETLNPLLKKVGEFVSETIRDIGRDEITAKEELEMKSLLLQLVREMADLIVSEQEEKVNKLLKRVIEKEG